MTDSKYIEIVYSPKDKPFTKYPKKLINHLVKKFNLNTSSSILELGCGRGEFLQEFTNLGMKGFGVDLSDYASTYCKEAEIKVLDMTKDELPVADVCIVRCVLQHLSNDLISQFVNKIKNKFKYLLITEHYPSKKNFTPNIDIVTGPKIRLTKDSGVDLASNPFNLIFKNQVNICKIYSKLMSGYLNTQLYKL